MPDFDSEHEVAAVVGADIVGGGVICVGCGIGGDDEKFI